MKKIFYTFFLLSFLFSTSTAQRQGTVQNQEDIDNFNKLGYAFSQIISNYVDHVGSAKVAEDAIKGMLEKLDPHSTYTNPEETRKMNEPLEAHFEGIGIQFNMLNDTLYIVQVIPGGPSEKVGLLAGDRIIMVDDTPIAGVNMYNSDIVKIIRGKKGTEVRIRVKRNPFSELLDFLIVRDRISTFSIDASYMADPKTGYIRLSRFSASSLYEFQKSVAELKSKGMENLILDLQENGGGYLQIAFLLADQFLEKDKLIVYTQGSRVKRSDAVSTESGIFKQGKLVILINENSASASEIVAGAVQDWDRGVIVGRRSFGKGLIQRAIELPDSSLIRLTIARYYTPSGRNIQKPYELGNMDAYRHELTVRYSHGEYLYADSIHFPDSLKFSTLVSNRTVYGGGGIMPDVFVPIDTTRYTDYHAKLSRYGLLNRMSMTYLDNKRKELNAKYPNMKAYREKFVVTEEILQQLINMAEDEKIEFDEEQYNKSKEFISLQLKALIANNLFESSEYFEIINEKNYSFQKALQIINDDALYAKILSEGFSIEDTTLY